MIPRANGLIKCQRNMIPYGKWAEVLKDACFSRRWTQGYGGNHGSVGEGGMGSSFEETMVL
jgi:hypothetical protein